MKWTTEYARTMPCHLPLMAGMTKPFPCRADHCPAWQWVDEKEEAGYCGLVPANGEKEGA